MTDWSNDSSNKEEKKDHRSAITGRYVKEATAERHPKTTVSETRSEKE
ncbi:hypothetical protein [Corynebacterium lowii]|uniref:Uncharacterized protein n=1 Tax=Corynebacterium lowii TaxID=1544413 RepID=A0A0Q0UHZ2_9CORY|nr:hypothetical protein [Corynebacterium lowii]KQB86001.1 hypothetical protein Clow_01743 [Corynebacterium lowii]MDP9850569.1 hypothetical protein [Corynebacterium lowii]